MTPFKGRHPKHRKEGTCKCRTVSRGLLQTAERQDRWMDGWMDGSFVKYISTMCGRDKTPVMQEDSPGFPKESSKDMVVYRKDTYPAPMSHVEQEMEDEEGGSLLQGCSGLWSGR